MTRLTNILMAIALFAAIGCAAKTEAEAPAYINANCPIMGNPVEADGGHTTWDGKEVGFCCDKCVAKFEKMDDAGKQAAIDEHNK